MSSYDLGTAPEMAASMASEVHPNTSRFHAVCNRIMAITPEGEGDMLVNELFQCIQFSAQFDKEKIEGLQVELNQLHQKYELLKRKYFEKKEALAQAEARSRAANNDSHENTSNEPGNFNGTTQSVLLNYVRFRRDIASYLMENAHLFTSDRHKASYVVTHLEGEAIQLFYRDARLAGRDAAKLSLREVLDLLEKRYGAENSDDPHRELVLEVFGQGGDTRQQSPRKP
ncbi:hypothetical protein IWZ01DRAFT_270516 [Phyllosticta capitalensis]